MRNCELLFNLSILVILLGIYSSSLSEIPNELITNLEITLFQNITLSGESQIYTNENFTSHKFFNIISLNKKI